MLKLSTVCYNLLSRIYPTAVTRLLTYYTGAVSVKTTHTQHIHSTGNHSWLNSTANLYEAGSDACLLPYED